jgi:hypothetical protein
MSWFRAKAFGLKGSLKDPTDVCPMLRMILIWGPISILICLLELVVILGVIVFVGVMLWQFVYGIINWNGAAGAALRAFLVKALLCAGAVGLVVFALFLVGMLIEGIGWLVRTVRNSTFAMWYSKRFPKKERPERPLKVRKEKAPKPPKPPRPPSGLQVFMTWVNGKLHGWCSPIRIVD